MVLIYGAGSPRNFVDWGRHQPSDHRMRSTVEVEADKPWEKWT